VKSKNLFSHRRRLDFDHRRGNDGRAFLTSHNLAGIGRQLCGAARATVRRLRICGRAQRARLLAARLRRRYQLAIGGVDGLWGRSDHRSRRARAGA